MRLEGLMKPFKTDNKYEDLMEQVRDERFPIGIYGISESARSYITVSYTHLTLPTNREV